MKRKERKIVVLWVIVLLLCMIAVVFGVVKARDVQQAAVSSEVQSEQSIQPESEDEEEQVQGAAQELEGGEDKAGDSAQEKLEEELSESQSQSGTENTLSESQELTEATPTITEEPEAVVQEGMSALHVEGTVLCDESGNPVQLRGISTHGIAWFPQYVNEECFKQLKEEWNANVVRLAMYTAESGGYCTDGDKDALKQLVKDGVAYATNNDLYVIIDWHILSDGNPNTYKEESKAFFKEMSAEYKDYPNVIYEICNEPNGGTGWKDIKSYAEEIIEVIRENDEDNIIIVGTPNWSQYVDQAAADPITSSENIMYALHYYAATHKDDLRQKMVDAYKAGLPIFVTEYGICDASGNGSIDETQANAWVDVMNDYGISYVAWNLSNKNETSAVIKSSSNKTSGFTENDLSASGKWVYQMLTGSEEIQLSGDTGVVKQEQSQTQEQVEQVEAGSSPSVESPAVSNSQNTVENAGQSTEKADAGVTGFKATVEVADSWKGEKGYCFNSSMSVYNGYDTNVESWEITLTYNSDIVDVQGWNGNFTVEGNKLHISSMDYNGWIAAGESATGIGFIITGAEDLSVVVE